MCTLSTASLTMFVVGVVHRCFFIFLFFLRLLQILWLKWEGGVCPFKLLASAATAVEDGASTEGLLKLSLKALPALKYVF